METATTETVTEETSAADLLYGNSDTENNDTDITSDSEKNETEDSAATSSEDPEGDKVTTDDANKDSTAETKTDEEGTAEIVYDLKLGENTFLSESNVSEATEFAKTHGLSNEAAQAVLQREDLAIANYVSSQAEANDVEINSWEKQVREDSVLGGDNLNTTVNNSKLVLDKFGSEEFVGILRSTGYGNHPDVVRFLSAVGASMRDDKLITGKEPGQTKSTEDIFYGGSN